MKWLKKWWGILLFVVSFGFFVFISAYYLRHSETEPTVVAPDVQKWSAKWSPDSLPELVEWWRFELDTLVISVRCTTDGYFRLTLTADTSSKAEVRWIIMSKIQEE